MKMIERIRKIKVEKDIKIFLDKGNLDISVPNSMSEGEAAKVSKEIATVDRILNDKFSEYKELKKQDLDLNGGKITKTADDYRKLCKVCYENTFDDE
jgi:hypothetical protein